MDNEKTHQEKYEEIQQKLQHNFGKILSDIAKTPGGLERLEILQANHEKLTKYDLTNLFALLDL